jgi:hypothetical protein
MDPELKAALMKRKMQQDTQADIDNHADPGMLANAKAFFQNDAKDYTDKLASRQPLPPGEMFRPEDLETVQNLVMGGGMGTIANVGKMGAAEALNASRGALDSYLEKIGKLKREGGYADRLNLPNQGVINGATDAANPAMKALQEQIGNGANQQDTSILQQKFNQLLKR